MILFNQIPNKSLFKTSEVCEICQIKPYVLRFWDTEFEQIESIVNSAGKKLYQKKDIIVVSVLKELLFDRKLTIEKARHELSLVDFNQLILNQLEEENSSSLVINEGFSEDSFQEDEKIEEDKQHQLPSFSSSQMDQLSSSKEILNSVLDRIDSVKHHYRWS